MALATSFADSVRLNKMSNARIPSENIAALLLKYTAINLEPAITRLAEIAAKIAFGLVSMSRTARILGLAHLCPVH